MARKELLNILFFKGLRGFFLAVCSFRITTPF